MSRSSRLFTLTLTAALAFTAPTLAADRYAAPDGKGFLPCVVGNPCNFTNAVMFAAAGDHIKLLPGTLVTNGVTTIQVPGLTFEPAVPGTRPVIASPSDKGVLVVQPNDPSPTTFTGVSIESTNPLSDADHEALKASSTLHLSDVVLRSRARVLQVTSANALIKNVSIEQVAGVHDVADLIGPGATISDLTGVAATGSSGIIVAGAGTTVSDSSVTGGATGLSLFGGVEAHRVTGRGTSAGIVTGGNGGMITDSVATVSGAGAALRLNAGTVTLRNVTAYGSAPGSIGLQTSVANTADARNILAEAPLADVKVDVGAALTLDHSMFGTQDGNVVDGGANVSTAPIFADAAAGNFHELGGSIDHGVTDNLIGTTDRAGQPRQLGPTVDIGAFEQPVPEPPKPDPDPDPDPKPDPNPNPNPNPNPDPKPGPGPDQGQAPTPAPPVVGSQSSTDQPRPAPAPPIIPPALDRHAPTLSALKASGKRRRSAKVGFSLSEAASIQVLLQKAGAGKRRGKACVKATKKLRKAKACSRFATLASARKSLRGGAVKMNVGRKLAPGRYRVTVTATDAAGNRAKPKTVSFRVAKPARKVRH